MPKPAPSITVTIGDKQYPVTFDVDALLRIEEATGRPMMDIFAMAAKGAQAIDGGRQVVQAPMIMRHVPLSVMIDFVAGATGKHADQALLWAQEGLVVKAFIDLVVPFMEAVSDMLGAYGGTEDAAAAGPTQPAGSDVPPPGQPLTSASGPVS